MLLLSSFIELCSLTVVSLTEAIASWAACADLGVADGVCSELVETSYRFYAGKGPASQLPLDTAESAGCFLSFALQAMFC